MMIGLAIHLLVQHFGSAKVAGVYEDLTIRATFNTFTPNKPAKTNGSQTSCLTAGSI